MHQIKSDYRNLILIRTQSTFRKYSSPMLILHAIEMAGFIEARQRLDSQLSENELVLKVRQASSNRSIIPAPLPPSSFRCASPIVPTPPSAIVFTTYDLAPVSPELICSSSGIPTPQTTQYRVQTRRTLARPARPFRSPIKRRETIGVYPERDVRVRGSHSLHKCLSLILLSSPPPSFPLDLSASTRAHAMLGPASRSS